MFESQQLQEFYDKFQIAKGLNPEDHIKLLSEMETYPKEQIIEVFNHFINEEKSPQVLLYMLKILGKYNDKTSISALTNLLLFKERIEDQEHYVKVRCMVATILGNLKDNDAVFPLLYVLNNKGEHYQLRLSVAEALGRIGDQYAVAPLIEVVSDEEEKSIYLRESAAKALGMIGDLRAIDPLVSILETKKGLLDKFTFLKERIIETLGRIGIRDDRTIKALSNALLDEAPYIRLGAIEALSEINDDRVFPLIEKMVHDEEEDVARGAINALYNIMGKDYIASLLNINNIPGWCKDEIECLLEEDDYEEEDLEEG